MPAVMPHLIRSIDHTLLKGEAAPDACGPKSKPLDELVGGHSRMVDTFIYEYPKLVRDAEPFARATADVRVAIIGTGFAGFTAAHELRRAGVENIEMFEARSDIGGRADSRVFTDDEDEARREYINEMGPMRVPENSKLFWHYLSTLQPPLQKPLDQFPNPGVVASEIIYQGTRSQWIGTPPPPWSEIGTDFGLFLDEALVYRRGENDLLTLKYITGLLQKETLEDFEAADIKAYWSHFIEKYENRSFIEAVLDFFDGQDGRPEWGPDKVDMFSTLGLGTGGFGPLFPVCFLEIFRLFLWDFAAEYMPNISMRGVIELFREAVDPSIHFETVTYVGIDRNNPRKVNVHSIRPDKENPSARLVTRKYDYVVVATTLRSMQVRMNLDGSTAPAAYRHASTPLFSGARYAPLRQAIRVPHIMNSSKLFGFLKKKPWESIPGWPTVPCGDDDIPVKCVLTDSLARQMYFLDPFPEDPKAGVNVLISYNWGDDSVKIMGVEDYGPNQVLTPGSNADFALKSAYQLGLEAASECDHVAQALAQIGIEDQDRLLTSVIWQKEPMIFGAFKIDYPQQYHYTSQVVYQYQTAQNEPGDPARVFLANNNCSFQGGWIEGAMQSAVNAASAVLRSMQDNDEAADFRMQNLLEPNPFGRVLDKLMTKYSPTIPGYRE